MGPSARRSDLRWIAGCCALIVCGLVALPATASAREFEKVIYGQITFSPAANPDDPAPQSVVVDCPSGFAALEGIYVTGSGSVSITGSTPTTDGGWKFTARNSSHNGQPQQVTVQVRCVNIRPFHQLLPPSPTLTLPAGAKKTETLPCHKDQVAVGWAEKHPDAGTPGVSTRIRELDLSGRQFTVQIQSTGTASQSIQFQVVCLDRVEKVHGQRLRFDVVGFGTTVQAPPNQFVEIGRKCPHAKSGEIFGGVLVTEFPEQPSGIFYYPAPFATPHAPTPLTAPASIFNSSPGTATVHGTTDCLGFRPVP
jgi:hypothetical protein